MFPKYFHKHGHMWSSQSPFEVYFISPFDGWEHRSSTHHSKGPHTVSSKATTRMQASDCQSPVLPSHLYCLTLYNCLVITGDDIYNAFYLKRTSQWGTSEGSSCT